MEYDFLTNNFTTYENVEEPKVVLQMPLSGDLDISDWSRGITSSGTPVVKDNTSQFVINNTEEREIQRPVELSTQTEGIRSTITSSDKKVKQGSLENNVAEAYNYLVSRGIPRGSAAGIVGNLYHENLRNPLQTVADSRRTTAYGIAGFNSKGDLPNLLKWSRENGIQGNPNFQQQLDYLVHCINTRPKLGILLDTTLSPESASFIWGKEFERFAGKGGRGYLNINDPEHKKRAKTSKSIFDRYGK